MATQENKVGSKTSSALILEAYEHTSNHRTVLQKSKSCSCIYCRKTFGYADINEWADNKQTAICPHCGVDAVIGSASGVELTKEFLKDMKAYWFSNQKHVLSHKGKVRN